MSNEVVFKGKVIRCTYNSDEYKVYAVDVDRNIYPNIKFTKYGNATITGNLHELGIGIEYEIRALEEHSKYGYGYKVLNIRRNKPNSSLDMQIFLSEILTPKQAQTLYEVYPDIVDRVMQNNLEDIDLNKLNGIKEFTFNIIKQKIIENFVLVDLVSEFQGILSLSMIKKLYEKYTSVQKVKSELKNNPYKCLCGLARVGFKTADSLLLEIDRVSKENKLNRKQPIIDFDFDLKSSEQRCLACIMYILEENKSSGHTKMNLIELKRQCEKLVPACSHHFINVIKHEDIYYNKEKLDVALKSTYDIELYIANRIKEALKINTIWDCDCEKYRNADGIELTDSQYNVLKKICKHNIIILNGSAGTGKSKTVASIIQLLDDNNKSFRLFAPTGRATKVLSEYTSRNATTIHRGLGYLPPNKWTYNEDYKLYCDVLIIDEFSMTDIFLFKKVLDAIDFNVTKLLLVGDNSQLPSVSCGNLLHDFMKSNIIPTTTLDKVFRYGEGGLMKVATDVRNCKQYLNKNSIEQCTFFGSNKDYVFINVDQTKIVKQTVALYQKLLSQGYRPEDIQVLTSYNKGDYGSVAINNHLQKVANKNYGTTGIKHGETTYYEGDLVIQTVNNYKAKIYVDDEWCFDLDDNDKRFIANGEIGKIIKIGMHDMIIDFDGTKIRYSREDLQGIKLGYSISIHKSQGGSAKVIILLTPRSHTYMLNSNLIYVGLTRMKEKCFHLGNVDTVNLAIKKKENFNRQTCMQELLK